MSERNNGNQIQIKTGIQTENFVFKNINIKKFMSETTSEHRTYARSLFENKIIRKKNYLFKVKLC